MRSALIVSALLGLCMVSEARRVLLQNPQLLPSKPISSSKPPILVDAPLATSSEILVPVACYG